MEYSTKEIIAELKRELDMRYRVYPKLVSLGKMQQEEADRRIGLIRTAIRKLSEIEQKQLF